MSALISAKDWSKTALGPRQGWSQSLTLVVDLMLASGFPMAVRWGPDFVMLYNDGYRSILGDKHPRALGLPFRDVWPEVQTQLKPLHDAILSGKRSAFFTEDLPLRIQRQGVEFEDARFTLSYSPVPDPSAPTGVGGVLVIAVETTTRVLTEHALRASEERYRTAMMLGRIGSWEVDFVKGTRIWTPEGMALFGIELAGGLGHVGGETDEIRRSMHPEDQHLLARYHALANSQDSFPAEYRVVKADGTAAWLSGYGRVLDRQADGKAHRLLNVATDITERKKVEAALGENELRLRWLASIVESSDDAIISKNTDGVITSWNRGAEHIFGYTAEEVIGQPITIVIPQDRQGEEHMILTRIRKGERVDHFETIRQRKDGGLIVVSLTVSPIKNSNGNIVGASKIARDITEQKRSQEQIVVLAREAEHRSKNLLATVQATVNLSQSDTPEGLKQAIEGRILALAKVHSLFVESRWTGADLWTIARQELAPYSETDETSVRIDGPQVLLEPNVAQAVAITLHELATNAAKYGSMSVPNGETSLMWSHEADGRLILHWRETGGPVVRMPTKKGFGTRITEAMIGQLKGKISFDWRNEGLVCEISLPV
ncbi:MAG: PAS domain S-box protein [Xanthobacteraceae bacterium]|jgi:PAS domain S-box-containing protein|uniref:PAS domain S-box protein n=1 Tax=Roseiarcus sp. TaxID=1969460 RepID=UPI003C27AF7F